MTPTEHQAAMYRIHAATETKTQMALADILAIRQSSISDAIRRGSIPSDWLIKLYDQFQLNPDWIRTGEGSKHLAGTDDPKVVTVVKGLEQFTTEDLTAELRQRFKGYQVEIIAKAMGDKPHPKGQELRG